MSAGAGTTSAFGQSMARLRSAQKSSKGAPPYSLFINRPLGRILAAAAYQVGMTPNQVTYVSAACTLAGLLVLGLGPAGIWTGVGVAALLVLGYALDSADGQLARLRGGGSLLGEWLDHMIDSVKVVTLHLAVLVAMYRFTDVDRHWLLVPLVFAVVSAVHFFGMILNDLVAREQRALAGRPAGPKVPASTVRSLTKLPTDYGVLCLAFLLLGSIGAFTVVYTILALATTGYTVLVARKWYGDVRRLDAERSAALLVGGAAR